VTPQRLSSNLLHRFYRGGARIAAFRGIPLDDDYLPEDWVGSVTTAWGEDEVGLSRLEDGRLVRDAIAADPTAFLGPELEGPGILVKLLDAGERLPVHVHPDDAFAQRELGLERGKTEAWVVLESGEVRVGWRENVEREQLERWVEEQDVQAMLDALNVLQLGPGDAVFVPAGVAHAIGAGIFMVEVQQPSDLSILLEWEGFALDGRRDGHLGLGFERALGAAELSARDAQPLVVRARDSGSMLPPEARAFFAAERVRGGEELEPAFSIVVVTGGAGAVGGVDVRRGETLLVPYAAGPVRLGGDLEAIRCLR
jgi:mannose-6-phosphate isomerase